MNSLAMFRCKKDVDRHSADIFRKLKTEKERNLRCYNIAKLYYGVGDYVSCRHFVSTYLSVSPKADGAHKLLGQALEALGQKEAALSSYKSSLELNGRQGDLVLKVCELLATMETVLDVGRAKYWCERGEELYPHHQAIFQLKERLIKSDGDDDPSKLEKLVVSEMVVRPLDENLRIKLLRMYLENGRVEDAYAHATEVEARSPFRTKLAWYECLADVHREFSAARPAALDAEFHVGYVGCLDRLATLRLRDHPSPCPWPDCVAAVFQLDQAMHRAAAAAAPAATHRKHFQEFLAHMQGQTCLHLATLVLRKAKNEPALWRESCRRAAALLLGALTPPPPDPRPDWPKGAAAAWPREAAHRRSQAGHVVLGMVRDTRTQFIEQVSQFCTSNWRERIYQRLFTSREHHEAIETSHFVCHNAFARPSLELPTLPQLRSCDEESQRLNASSLHHQAWLGMQAGLGKKPVTFHSQVFDGLQLACANATVVDAGSLCRLDCDAFLYAVVFCQEARAEEHAESAYAGKDAPPWLPAAIAWPLCTPAQADWWEAAHRVFTADYAGQLARLRGVLQRGIETIRALGNHGMDVQLIVRLARTFADRAASLSASAADESAADESAAVGDRAAAYWAAALPLIERRQRKQAAFPPDSRLFDYVVDEPSATELAMLADEARLFAALRAIAAHRWEDALAQLQPLRSPDAAYHAGVVYALLAEKELEAAPREAITSEMRSKHIILLTRARDSLRLAEDRLRSPAVDRDHRLHSAVAKLAAEMDGKLCRIEPDTQGTAGRGGGGDASDSSAESCRSDADRLAAALMANGSAHPMPPTPQQQQHTPRRLASTHHARGDFGEPDRARDGRNELTEQVRQLSLLVAGQDAVRANLAEQTRIMADTNRSLLEANQAMLTELRCIKTTLVEELCEVKTHVLELKEAANRRPAPGQLAADLVDAADDLYVFDDEDYANDVSAMQGGHFPSFPPYPEYAPLRQMTGLLGTSTVTYGQPPPAAAAADYFAAAAAAGQLVYPPPTQLGYYQTQPPPSMQRPAILAMQPALGALPFSDGQQLPDFRTRAADRALPVNVVITSSDAVPTATAAAAHQPAMSVTVPMHLRHGAQSQLQQTQQPHPARPPMAGSAVPAETPAAGTLHDFQISMPSLSRTPNATQLERESAALSPTIPLALSSLLSSVPSPAYSAVATTPTSAHPGLDRSNGSGDGELDDDGDGSAGRDFVPVIPLPAEVEANTGEEDETVLFQNRCKLYRFCEKEWRERGVGVLKLLRHDTTEKVRLLMRREQVLKICANHLVTSDTELTQMNPRAFMWFANDFADEQVRSEKLCARFKTAEEAEAFRAAFDDARRISPVSLSPAKPAGRPVPKPRERTGSESKNATKAADAAGKKDEATAKQAAPTEEAPKAKSPLAPARLVALSAAKSPSKLVTGGLTFSSPPVVKSADDSVDDVIAAVSASPDAAAVAKPSPFAGFSFGAPPAGRLMFDSPHSNLTFAVVAPFAAGEGFKTDASFAGFTGAGQSVFGGGADDSASPGAAGADADFVPTAEFAPVVPLPALVAVKTGEEDEVVVFAERAKLLRFIADTKEWKERGVGTFKILRHPATGRVRFLMRREQVFKVCCNHALTSQIVLNKLQTNDKAYTWYAQDYSDEKMETQLLALRFKTADQAGNFYDAVTRTQAQLVDDKLPVEGDAPAAAAAPTAAKPLAELFKPATGSWECKECYTRNDADKAKCAACEVAKPGAVQAAPKADAPAVGFSFGVPAKSNALADMFKPAAGSWECKECYTRNDADKAKCAACDVAKPGAVKTAPKAETQNGGFVFGVPAKSNALAELFKPAAGSWECKECYTRNDGDKAKCVACEVPRPGTTAATAATGAAATVQTSKTGSTLTFRPSASSGGFGLAAPVDGAQAPAFSFGVPAANAFTFGAAAAAAKPAVGFGAAAPAKPADAFTFGTPPPSEAPPPAAKFSFGSAPAPAAPAPAAADLAATPPAAPAPEGSKFTFGSPGKFSFSFGGVRPKSPVKSPGGRRVSENQDDDDSYQDDEGDNIYFAPVVPLPDKVPVCTGEEDELVLYCHRAKLFRFAASEWKERGVGDFKILKHRDTGKIRLVMRREQILKVCLNHFLSAELDFKVKDDKTWAWVAADFSDGEQSLEQFALRFKTPDIALEFKAALDAALVEQSQPPASKAAAAAAADETAPHGSDISPAMRAFSFGPGSAPAAAAPAFTLAGTLGGSTLSNPGVVRSLFGGSPQNDKSVDLTPAPGELEVVYELHVTPEEEAEAARLQLPANFFAYRRKAGCPGCPGCRDDSDDDEDNGSGDPSDVAAVQEAVPATGKASLWGLSNEVATPTFSTQTAAFQMATPIFGKPGQSPGGLFAKAEPAKEGLFGKSDAMQGGLFGKSEATQGGLFGKSDSTQGGLFGKSEATQGGLFGKTEATPGGLFGKPVATQGGLFGKPGQWESPIFGGAATTNLFGPPTSTPPIGSSRPLPAAESTPLAAAADQSDDAAAVPFLPFDASVSFANLATATPAKPAFAADSSATFSWSGAGTSLFGAAAPNADVSLADSNADDAAAAEEAEHDPHFEPIVPLPDKIEVRTGEEDEEKVFCHRAQLFRYQTSTKEWKERGVGDMKLLRHPGNNTYRLLLRRDQVHKVVLNQRVLPTLTLAPMATSDRAWVWCGMNHAEGAEPALEELAVRFKLPDTAANFRDAVVASVAALASSGNDAGAAASQEAEPEGQDHEEEDDDDDEGDDDEGDEDDYEEQGEVIFEKRVTLSMRHVETEPWQPYGQGVVAVTLMYQAGMEFVTVNMQLDGDESRFLSSVDGYTRLRHAGRLVEWTSTDAVAEEEVEPAERTYQAHFGSETAAIEYFQCLEQAKNACQNDES